jgi:hypothetical protein
MSCWLKVEVCRLQAPLLRLPGNKKPAVALADSRFNPD